MGHVGQEIQQRVALKITGIVPSPSVDHRETPFGTSPSGEPVSHLDPEMATLMNGLYVVADAARAYAESLAKPSSTIGGLPSQPRMVGAAKKGARPDTPKQQLINAITIFSDEDGTAIDQGTKGLEAALSRFESAIRNLSSERAGP